MFNTDRYSFKSGFTLLELMLVMIILTVLTSIVNLRFRDSALFQSLKQEVRVVESQVSYMRKTAVLREKVLVMKWLEDEEKLGLYERLENGELKEIQNNSPYSSENQFNIEMEPEEVSFFPDFSSDPFIIKFYSSLSEKHLASFLLQDGKEEVSYEAL